MKKELNIAILDTSIMSFNIGDQIIMESSRNALRSITDNAFVVNLPTHSPLFHKYEFSIRKKDGFQQSLDKLQLKFVCGTNLAEKDMKKRKNLWNLHTSDSKYIKDFILVGVGTDGLPEIQNNYTKRFYKRMLSKDFIHSTRDEKTKNFLESMGFRAINTGCTTLWPLTEENCKKIPTSKAKTVVFTLTDYCQDLESDIKMISVLCDSYDEVYFWPQGILDRDYFDTLVDLIPNNKIKLIVPLLEKYNAFLIENECDYVGTRLHAGIKAMQVGRRTIIVGVDNRARDIYENYSIPLIERSRIDDLLRFIKTDFSTRIKISQENINQFMSQFADIDD